MCQIKLVGGTIRWDWEGLLFGRDTPQDQEAHEDGGNRSRDPYVDIRVDIGQGIDGRPPLSS